MTAIVGVLNSQGIAIAADSAVTLSGGNVKKVYNKSNKIFTLSKYHPVGIAIYSNANFMGVPLETLIKMYRSNLKEKSFDTLKEYKDDFLDFLKNSLSYINQPTKDQQLYNLCNENYRTLPENIKNAILNQNDVLQKIDSQEASIERNKIAETEIEKYFNLINSYNKSSYFHFELSEIESNYKDAVNEILAYIENGVKAVYPDINFSDNSKNLIKNLIVEVCNIRGIFEAQCGLIFIGFGEKEIFPSSQVVLLGSAIANKLRYLELDMISISPGILDSNILPYVQGDVTFSVLTGIDPSYQSEINTGINTAFETIKNNIIPKINTPDDATKIKDILEKTPSELIKNLEEYKRTKITNPLLDVLKHMGKEDMAELAESLVNITSLKRKFSTNNSADEGVGGPVDVAVITKGDGFIWMKRKHYFDIEINKGFLSKYYK